VKKLLGLIGLLTLSLNATQIQVTQKVVDGATTALEVQLVPGKGQAIFKEFLSLSVDHPSVKLTSWTSSEQPQSWYNASLHKDLQAFTTPVTLKLQATKAPDKTVDEAMLHISYLSSEQKSPAHELFPIQFAKTTAQTSDIAPEQAKTMCSPIEQLPTAPQSWSFLSLSDYLERLITASQSLWLRFFLIMLLGLLMSLTPCIYPMIPITIGIMQGQGQRSVWQTAAHAAAYSTGIAITFAMLGLFAAASGTIFGMLLTNPIVVLCIAGLMIYLAFSMFGFYEMRLPQFLQQNNTQHKGSILSSFLFGAVSGTVASPCLSPGLALVLCIVAAIGNKFIGFLLLFAFGIGLSIPLMIIGTASGSMHRLPQAGAWMVEVKKVFGFLLLGMSFYYLKNILPWYIMLWMIGTFMAIVGAYYLLSNNDHDNRWWRRIKNLIGMASIAVAVLLFFEAYQTTFHAVTREEDTFWLTDYESARAVAQREQKPLFLDFWAPSCSICTAVDKTLLKDTKVRAALGKTIPTKLELVMTDSVITKLKDQFAIVGLPTFLLVDPTNERIIKRWGGELYHTEPEKFVEILKELTDNR
jgi:thiol:disulfide interchange protein